MKANKPEIEKNYYEILGHELFNRKEASLSKKKTFEDYLAENAGERNQLKLYNFISLIGVLCTAAYLLSTLALNITANNFILSVVMLIASIIIRKLIKFVFFESKKFDLMKVNEEKYNKYIFLNRSQEDLFSSLMDEQMKNLMKKEKEQKGSVSLRFIKKLIN